MDSVRAESVSKEYVLGKQRVKALSNVNLTVGEGEFLAIAGPSGSGKSTLLNLIGCLDVPTSGKIFIRDQDVGGKTQDELADLRAATIGFIFQTFNLLPVLSAVENIEYPLLNARGVAREERRERVQHYLAMVGLEKFARHRPNELSGIHPAIVLADEPTANLDHKTGESILQLMREINRAQGTTFIFSTHDPRVMELAGRVVRMQDGEMLP